MLDLKPLISDFVRKEKQRELKFDGDIQLSFWPSVGVTLPMVRLNSEPASKLSKRTRTSSNAMPACLSSTQGRMDQEE